MATTSTENDEGYYPTSQLNEISPMTMFLNKHRQSSGISRNVSSGILHKERRGESVNKRAKDQQEEMSDWLDSIVTVFFFSSFAIVTILVISSLIWWRAQIN